LALFAGGWLIYDALIVTEAESAETYVRRLAADLPTRPAASYIDEVDLDRFGFRLSYRGLSRAFGKGEQEAFLQTATALAPQVLGSTATVRSVEVEMAGPVANVKLNVLYERDQAQAPVERAFITFQGALAKEAGQWKVTKLSAEPTLSLRDRL